MPDSQPIAKELRDLIQICHDGQHGYREAARHAKDPDLKLLLNEVGLERARFARDLEHAAARWGESEGDRTGTASDAVRRGWANQTTAAGGGDDAILASLEAGDEFATSRYDQAIQDEALPTDIIGILRNQAQAIVGTLDRIRALRRRQRAA